MPNQDPTYAGETLDSAVNQVADYADNTATADDLWILELMKQKVDSLRSTLENRITTLKDSNQSGGTW